MLGRPAAPLFVVDCGLWHRDPLEARKPATQQHHLVNTLVGAAGSRLSRFMENVVDDDNAEGRGGDTGEVRGDDRDGLSPLKAAELRADEEERRDDADEDRGDDEEDISLLKVTELRALCEAGKVSAVGLKKELVVRLRKSRADASGEPTQTVESVAGPSEPARPRTHPRLVSRPRQGPTPRRLSRKSRHGTSPCLRQTRRRRRRRRLNRGRPRRARPRRHLRPRRSTQR